jgi:hypothetical protein
MKRLILVFAMLILTLSSIHYPYKCTRKDRKVQFCTEEYIGVCGMFNPRFIQCFAYPCGQTYSTVCEACKNKDVISVELGTCDSLHR